MAIIVQIRRDFFFGVETSTQSLSSAVEEAWIHRCEGGSRRLNSMGYDPFSFIIETVPHAFVWSIRGITP